MAANIDNRARRRLIVTAGALATAGAVGLWSWNSSDHLPLTPMAPGWYLISRPGTSDGERQLVAWNDHGQPEHVLETENGSTFLSATLSPDQRFIALLKRVMRGSMPTDAIGLYDSRTFQRIAVVEVQIAFQRVPTFTIGWSADATRIAVPYDNAGRTLLFGVNGTHTLALQSITDHGSFQFHPTRADIALYASRAPAPAQLSIVQLAGSQEILLETIAGSDAQWSPDGSQLAYLSAAGPAPGSALLIRDQATMQTQTLPRQVRSMVWSPDSRRLALYCLASNDPFQIGKILPTQFIPGWQPAVLEPRLLIYDTMSASTISIGQLRKGFQLAHLQWLNPDWLLVIDVKAKQSFMTDRRGQQQRPVTALDDYTPLLRWIAQV